MTRRNSGTSSRAGGGTKRRSRPNGDDTSFITSKTLDPVEEAMLYTVVGEQSGRRYYIGFSRKEAEGVVGALLGRPTMDVRSLPYSVQQAIRAHRL